MKKKLYVSLILLISKNSGMCLPSDIAPWKDPLPHLIVIQTMVSNNLEAFKLDHNSKHLIDSYTLSSTREPAKENYRWDNDIIMRQIQLVLTIVNECDKTRNRAFDFNNPPSAKVLPPIRPNNMFAYFPGVAPEEIEPPEARRQYEQAIADNRKVYEEYEKQLKLKQIIRQGLDEARSFLVHHLDDDQTKQRAIMMFTNVLSDPQLRKGITSGLKNID